MTNAGLFASENFEEVATPVMALYSARKGQPAPETESASFHGMVFGGGLYRDDVNKLSYVLNSHDEHLAAKQTPRAAAARHLGWAWRRAIGAEPHERTEHPSATSAPPASPKATRSTRCWNTAMPTT